MSKPQRSRRESFAETLAPKPPVSQLKYRQQRHQLTRSYLNTKVSLHGERLLFEATEGSARNHFRAEAVRDNGSLGPEDEGRPARCRSARPARGCSAPASNTEPSPWPGWSHLPPAQTPPTSIRAAKPGGGRRLALVPPSARPGPAGPKAALPLPSGLAPRLPPVVFRDDGARDLCGPPFTSRGTARRRALPSSPGRPAHT